MNLLALPIAYLLGSLPFAIIVTRLMGMRDPRSYGSGNPGATNVLRSGSKLAAVLTLLGDAGKGWLAVWLAQIAGLDPTLVALCGLAAFLGHLFPLFLGFKGGKGVATALGVLGGLYPLLALAAALIWLAVALITRYSSLAALIAAVAAGPLAFWLQLPGSQVLAILLMGALLCWRHTANIRRLLDGSESRIGRKR